MTTTKKSKTLDILESARSKALLEIARASASGNMVLKVEWQRRMSFIEGLRDDFVRWREEGGVPPKRVFVSYSKNRGGASVPGEYIFQKLKGALERHHLEVVTGFERTEGDHGEVLSRVLGQLNRSTVFVGIFTKAIKTLSAGKEVWAPGVWLMEEKGMALALRKSFVWMVEEGIDFGYWFKTTPTNVFVMFNASNLEEKIDEVVVEVKNRYKEELERFISVQDRKGVPVPPQFSGIRE